jgi:subtilisin inhibitor-like
MVRTYRLLSAMLLAGFLLTAAVPAASASIQMDGQPRSVFVLTVTDGEKPDPATSKPVVLTCEPTGGTHPVTDKACAQLADVDGVFETLNVDPSAICPLIYQPVTVTARGDWRGRLVGYQETFANTCVMLARTGSVFAF